MKRLKSTLRFLAFLPAFSAALGVSRAADCPMIKDMPLGYIKSEYIGGNFFSYSSRQRDGVQTLTVEADFGENMIPDFIELALELKSEAVEAEQAKVKDASVTTRVTEVARAAGISSSDIRSSARVLDYRVERQLIVTVRDIARSRLVANELIRAAGTQVAQEIYRVNEQNPVLLRVRERELGLLLSAAERYAGGQGKRLGRLLETRPQEGIRQTFPCTVHGPRSDYTIGISDGPPVSKQAWITVHFGMTWEILP